MTACPPPKIIDKNVPSIVVNIFKLACTITHTEFKTSINISRFFFTHPISPCCATEKSSNQMRKHLFEEDFKIKTMQLITHKNEKFINHKSTKNQQHHSKESACNKPSLFTISPIESDIAEAGTCGPVNDVSFCRSTQYWTILSQTLTN